jgi:hypothetical protein
MLLSVSSVRFRCSRLLRVPRIRRRLAYALFLLRLFPFPVPLTPIRLRNVTAAVCPLGSCTTPPLW